MTADMPDDDLLEALLSGSLDERDPRVRERLAAAPELAEHLDTLRALSSASAERAEVLSDLTREVPGEAAILAGFERHMERSAAPRPRRLPWIALAAALLAVVGWFAWRGEPALRNRATFLGREGTVKLLSEGRYPDRPFVWERVDDPRCERYELRIHDLDQPLGSDPWKRVLLSETQYVPTAVLPTRFSWEVQALDASGGTVGSPSSRAGGA